MNVNIPPGWKPKKEPQIKSSLQQLFSNLLKRFVNKYQQAMYYPHQLDNLGFGSK